MVIEGDGSIAVNSNKFTVAAASGNTVIAGTLDVSGAVPLGATTLSINGNKVLDAQQNAIADVSVAVPNDGSIGGLTIDTPTAAEVQALRDECESLRDAVANIKATLNSALAALR